MTRSQASLLTAVLVGGLAGCGSRPFLYVYSPVDGTVCPVGAAPRLDALVYLLDCGNHVPLVGQSLLQVTVTVDSGPQVVVPYDQLGYIGWDLPTEEGRHDVRVEAMTNRRSFATEFAYTVSSEQAGTECVAPGEEAGDSGETGQDSDSSESGESGDTAGKDTAGKDTAGKDTAGKDTAGKDTGKDTAGKDTAGKDTAGKDTAGKDTAGKDTSDT